MMLMPMLWTNDVVDDMLDPFVPYDPFEDVVALVPTKEEVKDAKSTAKSIDRHAKKEVRSYGRQLRHTFQEMDKSLRAMKSDVRDDGDHFTITADLPGFDKSDIQVELDDGMLYVKARHSVNHDEKDEKTGKFLRRERSESAFARAFEVGEDVKPEDVNAKYENGVLTLTVPKKQIEEKKDENRIAIE